MYDWYIRQINKKINLNLEHEDNRKRHYSSFYSSYYVSTLLSLWFIIKKYHTIDRTKNQLDFSATLFVCLFVCSKKTGKIESETQGKTILGD